MRAWPALPVLLLALPALAAEPPPWDGDFLESDPDELLEAVRELPPPPAGAEVEILLEELTQRFDERGGREATHRKVFRVLPSADLVAASTFTATWVPSREERPRMRARVTAADGRVFAFAPDTVGEGLLSGQEDLGDEGRRVLVGRLPGVGAGAVVEQEVVLRVAPPPFPENLQFPLRGEPTRLARFQLDFPRSRPLRFAVRGMSVEPVIRDEGGRRSVRFEAGPLPAVREPTPGAPAPDDPRVFVGTASSWAEVARAWHAALERRLAGSEADLGELVEDLPRDGGTDAVVAALLERIAVRAPYAATGQGASYVPREPAETLTRGRGGPIDLAVLTVAALRSLRIRADLVLVALFPPAPDPDFPGVNFFDHAVVALPGSPTRYVDPSDPATGGRFLPFHVQGKPALVVAPSTTALGRLPAWKAADTTYRNDVSIELAERGPARLDYRHECTAAAASLKRQWDAERTPEQRETYRRGVGTALKAEGDVALTIEAGSPGGSYRMRAESGRSRLGSSDEKGAEAPFLFGDLITPLPAEVHPWSSAAVTHDLLLVPFVYEVTVRVVPPPGFTPRPLPPEKKIACGPVTLVQQFEQSADGTVIARARLDTGDRPILGAAEAEELRLALQGAGLVTRIGFERRAAALFAAGRVPEAVDEVRRLIALHPREALHHEELAELLLDVGLGEASRAEARRAVELEPASATAQGTLSWVLQHDASGRRYGPGWDRAGAIAAYRRRLELLPGDEEAGRLATLLAHDAFGGWYGPGAEVEAALALHRTGTGFIGGTFRDNAVAYLLHTGRHAELIEAAPGFTPGSPRDSLWLAAVAITQGAEAALRKAEELLPDAEARRKALAELPERLRLLRRYEVAADVLERQSVGAPNAHELSTRVAELREKTRLEDRPRSPADPSAVFERLLDLLTRPAPREDEVRALLADALEAELPDLDLVRLTNLRRPPPGDEPGVLGWADDWVSTERAVEGDDASGYRVRLHWPGGSRIFFVVREGGAYRLRASGLASGPLGEEALACLERGDVAGARRWLSWAAAGDRSDDRDCDRLAPARRVVDRGDAATPDELRRAAAVLAAESPVPGRLDRALEVRRAATDPAEALALDQGLAFVAARDGRGAEAATIAERLAPRFPLARDVFYGRLAGAGDRRDRLAAIAALRPAAERAGAEALLDSLVYAAGVNGDLALADAIGRARLEAGVASASILNSLAWNALFREELPGDELDRAIGWARDAVRRDGRAWVLHTLATLLAESGRDREALDTLRASIDRRRGQVEPADFYVLGRVAERLGLVGEAAAAYRRVTAAPDDTRNGAAVLARRRLEALAPSPGTAALPPPGVADR